ncbi:Protein Wnt-8a Precursor [Larimichthys crocea]|uniref:Protein Wnt n=1 Tax=Larimichthys crocea TaxID=215358 RepID=A0A6G0I4D4_LARCR|nr:Protein Wnt-8a Precursor [Larimichthys crocea]
MNTVNSFLWLLPLLYNMCPGHAWMASLSSPTLGACRWALRLGLRSAKHQFAWDRWNCPDSATQLKGLRRATRETSFVHAISAAGVMYTLTRNCSLGDLDNCGCDVSNNGKIGGRGWLWGGCSDNVDFGERISKQHVDAQGDRSGLQGCCQPAQQRGWTPGCEGNNEAHL